MLLLLLKISYKHYIYLTRDSEIIFGFVDITSSKNKLERKGGLREEGEGVHLLCQPF